MVSLCGILAILTRLVCFIDIQLYSVCAHASHTHTVLAAELGLSVGNMGPLEISADVKDKHQWSGIWS